MVLPDGTYVTPSAEQIYLAAVEGQASDALPGRTSAAGLPVINFSRYPLLLELRIEARQGGAADALCVTPYAMGDRIAIPMVNVSSRVADHVTTGEMWYPLARGALEEVREILSRAGVPEAGEINLKQYLTLLQLASKYPAIRDLSGDAASALRQRATAGDTLPAGFVGTLYPYQKDGWQWLGLIAAQGIGGILADEMGLGKTVQIVALLVAEINAKRGPCLVAAPATLLENWRRELAKFAPGLSVLVHQGSERTGLPRELGAPHVIVTSYDTLVRDLVLFRAVEWNIVVLDEAQAIKNAETKRSSAAKRIPRRVGIAVTGTPVENRLSDLWSIADFALPGFLGKRATFEKTFANDERGAEALEPLVSPIVLRRKVVEVAGDLPGRIDIPQALDLTKEQAMAYDEIRRAIQAEYGAAATLVSLTRLRMFCAHPSLVEGIAGDPAAVSRKYARLCEILDEIVASGEKAIIFTSFKAMTDLLVEDLGRRFAIPTAFIDGRTAIDERQLTIDRFSAVSGSALLVLNPRAAGTGLNITAANHVIHYNLEWNPAVEDQASARAYRRGQTRPVTVHRLFYADTVEEVIDQRLTSKRALASRAVIGVDGGEDNLADIAAALARSPVTRGADRVSH